MQTDRSHLDCSDCEHYPHKDPSACRTCTNEQERTGQWLPMFVRRIEASDTGSLETSESEALPYPCAVVPAPRLPRLIGLTGVARAGKDTAADYLVREHGFVKHSFAAPIREFVARILGLSLTELEACKESPIRWLTGTPTPRQLMQTIGTAWGRDAVDRDLWVKSCFERARRDMGLGRSVVICDVRFDNEALALERIGGRVWQLKRDGAGTAFAHASEAGVSVDLVHVALVNGGSFKDLYELIEGALA